MANNTIAVLRQMLASLDDAKKYQSLRDVMSTMNAPDLAAVFEDLPEEKMPVLFRLCPKDLAADVFAELSSETQEALIRGLTDRELKSVVEELCVDDATDLVEEMPANVVKRILKNATYLINELLWNNIAATPMTFYNGMHHFVPPLHSSGTFESALWPGS